MSSQTPFSPPTLPLPIIPVDDLNAAPRCPVILVLDTSASMTGAPIAGLEPGEGALLTRRDVGLVTLVEELRRA